LAVAADGFSFRRVVVFSESSERASEERLVEKSVVARFGSPFDAAGWINSGFLGLGVGWN
jgi:hypothetical protein